MTQLARRAALAALSGGAWAALAGPARAQQLSEADRADVTRIEAYLNGVRTMRARFLQVSENGRTAHGTFWLSRPGRLRLEYDPPVPTIVVVTGGQLIHFDAALGQENYLRADGTPAGILVRDQIRLSGDIQVTRVERSQGAVQVTVVRTRDPNDGRVSFTFAGEPMQLTQWQVVDGRGRTTRVRLSDTQVGVPVDARLFRFDQGRPLPSTGM